MDASDWRDTVRKEARAKIVNKILDELKTYPLVLGSEGVYGLRNIVERFEEKFFTTARSQSDYIRKLALKILLVQTKCQSRAKPRNQV